MRNFILITAILTLPAFAKTATPIIPSGKQPVARLGITPADVERIKAQAARQTIVEQSAITSNGVQYIVRKYRRGGKYHTVVNPMKPINGKEISNTFRERLAALQSARDEAFAKWQAEAETNAAAAKVTKDIRKAAKRAEKNLSKIVKTIEQARKKAGSEEEAELYDLLIEILSDPEKEDD